MSAMRKTVINIANPTLITILILFSKIINKAHPNRNNSKGILFPEKAIAKE